MRRLYFLFPDVEHTERVVTQLEQAGLERKRMHALAKAGIDISPLPPSTSQQKRDCVWFLERLFWNGNLILFAIVFAAFLVSLYWGFSIWSALALLLMLATFTAGERFAVKLPHAHLSEVKGALAHGEILLMVDVPKDQVAEVDDRVLNDHPEAQLGGVGWSINALGV